MNGGYTIHVSRVSPQALRGLRGFGAAKATSDGGVVAPSTSVTSSGTFTPEGTATKTPVTATTSTQAPAPAPSSPAPTGPTFTPDYTPPTKVPGYGEGGGSPPFLTPDSMMPPLFDSGPPSKYVIPPTPPPRSRGNVAEAEAATAGGAPAVPGWAYAAGGVAALLGLVYLLRR